MSQYILLMSQDISTITENASGCIDTSSSILIQVNNLPEPEIIFGTDVYCFGDTIIGL